MKPFQRLPIIWLLLNVFIIVAMANGQVDPSNELDSLIQQGIEHSIQHRYGQAEAIFRRMIEQAPEYPAGYFFMAATIQSKMMDFEMENWESDFFHYLERTIQIARAVQQKQADADPIAQFYHGSALCYLAFYESRQAHYLDAVRHGLAGISILKKVVARHPDCYDAYFGIGSYKYWRSQVTRYLNWLPLIADEREEGIRLVQQAVEQGKFTQPAAMNELIWILLDRNRPEDAYYWASKGIDQFPRSRFFLWGMAKSAYALASYAESVGYYQQLLISLTSDSLNNHYNEYICRLHLAEGLEKLERCQEANDQIIALDSLRLSNHIENRLKKQQKQFALLKKRIALISDLRPPIESLASEP